MPDIKSFKSPEAYRKWYRDYREKNRTKIRDYNRDYNRSWRLAHGTEKDTIRRKVCYAIEKGILKRGNCEVCGNIGAEGHHFDYSKPLQVIWLCPVHHKAVHKNLKKNVK